MIIHADILEWAATYQGEPFHALLTDPPYHLTEITKRFGKADAAPAQFGTDGAFQRASKGFMGRTWDGGDIAFRPETWATLAQHLYPGAFGMAFASTRGWHRMACAIEDAGLIIHPVIMCWTFLSGFPKATRIDTQIDKAAGETGGRVVAANASRKRGMDFGMTAGGQASYTPATDAARAWEGHRYGLQALKPALEPVIVFQKPYADRPVDCITRTGAGALNIDGARIGTNDALVRPFIARTDNEVYGKGLGAGIQDEPNGRWPSNLTLVHHPACTDSHCDASCPCYRLGQQSGVTSGGAVRRNSETGRTAISTTAHNPRNPNLTDSLASYGDSGTAARMFYNADWMYERLEAADPATYHAKASTAEREAGLGEFEPTTVDDGRAKSIDNAYLRGETSRRNVHPTIKPISLAKHLATLLLPPPEYGPRRLLIPFAGVASEMIGAELAGWEAVTGIEREGDHIPIAQARLDWWRIAARRLMTTDPETILTMRDQTDGLSLFDLLEAA